MDLADYIKINKARLIERWKNLVQERHSLDLSEFADDLPEFLDDMASAAHDRSQGWPPFESARKHGHGRMRLGAEIGSLSVEITLVGEVLLMLAEEDEQHVHCEQTCQLMQIIRQATAVSVNAHVALRDQELAEQTAKRFFFLAHEIRGPLQNARLAATLLASSDTTGRQPLLARLDRALYQLTDLVDLSLAQARFHAEPTVHLERLNAGELARIAASDVRAHAEVRGLRIEAETQCFELDADRKLLLSALTNLLTNAIKFTHHEGASITLRAHQVEQRAVFEVEDRCGGMREDLPARLFTPFVQGDSDRSGFGLGLAIVKQAVDAHHGVVHVRNRPGEGCTFVISLPVEQDQS
jgi:signal transduction histidine kinase